MTDATPSVTSSEELDGVRLRKGFGHSVGRLHYPAWFIDHGTLAGWVPRADDVEQDVRTLPADAVTAHRGAVVSLRGATRTWRDWGSLSMIYGTLILYSHLIDDATRHLMIW